MDFNERDDLHRHGVLNRRGQSVRKCHHGRFNRTTFFQLIISNHLHRSGRFFDPWYDRNRGLGNRLHRRRSDLHQRRRQFYNLLECVARITGGKLFGLRSRSLIHPAHWL